MCLRRGFHIVERYFFSSSSSSQFYLVNSVTRKLYWQRGDSRMTTNTYNMPSTDGGGQSGWGWVYCNKRINMSLVWCLVVWKSYQLFFSTKTASSHGRAGFWGWIRVKTEKYLHRVSFLFFLFALQVCCHVWVKCCSWSVSRRQYCECVPRNVAPGCQGATEA